MGGSGICMSFFRSLIFATYLNGVTVLTIRTSEENEQRPFVWSACMLDISPSAFVAVPVDMPVEKIAPAVLAGHVAPTIQLARRANSRKAQASQRRATS
jgi:hypothetical protein